MIFLEGAPLTMAMVLAGQHIVWEWNAWVNAMQSALFQVDPTQESRGWSHTFRLSQYSKFATDTEKFLLNVAIFDFNGASMAGLDQVAHFKRGLEGSMYDRPTDVDELTKGPIKTLMGIVGKCRAIFQAHGGAEAWKGRQDAQGEGRPQGRRFKVRGPGGSGHDGQGQGAQDRGNNNKDSSPARKLSQRRRRLPTRLVRPPLFGGQANPSTPAMLWIRILVSLLLSGGMTWCKKGSSGMGGNIWQCQPNLNSRISALTLCTVLFTVDIWGAIAPMRLHDSCFGGLVLRRMLWLCPITHDQAR